VLELLDPWRELVLHVLAFVPARGAASLHAPAYTSWVRARFAREGFVHLDEDAAVLGALHDRGGLASAGVEMLPWCFANAARMTAALRAGPDAWTVDDVDHPAALALARSPEPALTALTALVTTEMALARTAFAAGHTAHLGAALEAVLPAVRPWFARARAEAPRGAEAARCTLSAVLGARGRVYPRLVPETPAVMVGAPLAWTGLPAAHAALQWLHERAVMAAYATGAGGYLDAEARAWAALARLLRGSPLETEHRAWQGRFDARAVGAEAGQVGAEAVDAVITMLRG